MNNKIRISVIIPVFNAGKFIIETLDSISNQLDENQDEIIIIDDCSTDSTWELLKVLSLTKKNIKLFQTYRNSGGPALPRNIGISHSRGIFIAFCDADDIWLPGKLEKQLNFLDKYDFVCSEKIVFTDKFISPKICSPNHYEVLKIKSFIGSNPIPNSSVIFKKLLKCDISFNESSDYFAVEDYDLWIKMVKSGIKVCKIRQPLIGYRLREGQISRNKFNMLIKVFYVYKDHFSFFYSIPFIIFYVLKHSIRIFFMKIGFKYE